MKNISKQLFRVMASVLTVLAATEVKTASFWIIYQPKPPKSLVK
ncbi:MAG: cyclic lactone autoinducer peptide [Clostridia bacterium]|nr:cyclic lactone autoinducer peptide [Clostridia bacterium]